MLNGASIELDVHWAGVKKHADPRGIILFHKRGNDSKHFSAVAPDVSVVTGQWEKS